MADVQAGLGRIARELRDMTTGRGSGGEDARAELARLWARIEDIVENRLDPVMRDARGMARDAAHDARGMARGVARDARGLAHDARERLSEGRDAAVDAAERVRDATRNHPLIALGIVAAAAFALASLARARR